MLIYDIKPTTDKLELAEVNGYLDWNNKDTEAQRIIDLRKDLRKMSDDELYKIINKGLNQAYQERMKEVDEVYSKAYNQALFNDAFN